MWLIASFVEVDNLNQYNRWVNAVNSSTDDWMRMNMRNFYWLNVCAQTLNIFGVKKCPNYTVKSSICGDQSALKIGSAVFEIGSDRQKFWKSVFGFKWRTNNQMKVKKTFLRNHRHFNFIWTYRCYKRTFTRGLVVVSKRFQWMQNN